MFMDPPEGRIIEMNIRSRAYRIRAKRAEWGEI